MNNTLAPHIRTESTARHMLLDVLLISVVLCFFSAFCYGLRPVLVVLSGTLSAMLSEALCCLFRRQSLRVLLDGSAAVTGTVIGLLMSPMVDYWVPMIGAAFAIIVVKAPFGGYGRNVFNPAAAGMAILSYCFPTRLFAYPAAGSAVRLPLDMHIPEGAGITETSLAAQLRAGATPASSRIQLLIGDFAGPIGATVSILGGLVVGNAAVEAHIVSAGAAGLRRLPPVPAFSLRLPGAAVSDHPVRGRLAVPLRRSWAGLRHAGAALLRLCAVHRRVFAQ